MRDDVWVFGRLVLGLPNRHPAGEQLSGAAKEGRPSHRPLSHQHQLQLRASWAWTPWAKLWQQEASTTSAGEQGSPGLCLVRLWSLRLQAEEQREGDGRGLCSHAGQPLGTGSGGCGSGTRPSHSGCTLDV